MNLVAACTFALLALTAYAEEDGAESGAALDTAQDVTQVLQTSASGASWAASVPLAKGATPRGFVFHGPLGDADECATTPGAPGCPVIGRASGHQKLASSIDASLKPIERVCWHH